jgi:hypothetical protein
MNGATRATSAALGLAVMVVGCACFFHSCSAMRAHAMDWRERISAGTATPEEAIPVCARAHKLYPFNYRICEWAAILAYDAVATCPYDQRPWFLQQSEAWCDIALEQNPFSGSLRRLKARFLERDNPLSAAEYWIDYLNWVYWNEANHYVLVELYAAADELELAEEALKVIEGRRYHKEAEKLLFDAWVRRENARERTVAVPQP